ICLQFTEKAVVSRSHRRIGRYRFAEGKEGVRAGPIWAHRAAKRASVVVHSLSEARGKGLSSQYISTRAQAATTRPQQQTADPPSEASMERPSRRSAAQSNSTHANGDSSSMRRRRREASMKSSSKDNASASQSDGDAETDSSSVAAMETGSSVTRSSKKLQSQQRDAKKKDDGNPASSGHDDVDGDDEHEEEEGDDDLDLSSSESHGSHGANGMNKRERSLSNVSTTSSSSSIASDHNEEDRLTIQLEKLKELEKKKKMVEDGTLAEYCRRVTEFKEERNQLMETAEWHKSLQLKNSQDLYGFEVQRAHNLWGQAKDVLKSEMLGQVDALLSSLKKELEELSKAEA
uniref:Uncharacterized protein n=1 Tax=Globisporangium ultimum (strain ATCC 200006 / CBS 805.95 / DAOM BR144) TaxID=431595 RepID=K3X2Z9_GLOUD